MKRIGHCSRCGKCCNANSFPEGTTIATVREDGSCTYYHHGEPGGCLKQHTVSGKPLVCQLFPMGPSDITSIPECTYSFADRVYHNPLPLEEILGDIPPVTGHT